MNDLTLARPEALLLFSLVPVFLLTAALGYRARRRQARAMARRVRPGTGFVPLVLGVAAFAVAVVAFAQPRWGTETVPLIRTGADIMFVLDVSRSMDAADVPPSRLAAAKSAIVASLDRGGGDRVGLVVFAGSAHLQFPLTTDPAAASLVIERIESGSVFVSGGSALDEALDLARVSLDGESEAGRLVVLITDGDNLGDDPATAASGLRSAGISLLVVGVGTAGGAPIPLHNLDGEQLYLEDAGGPIISSLNEALLIRVADSGGGRYLGDAVQSLPGAVASRVSALQTAQLSETPAEVPVEQFDRFSIVAALLLAIALLGPALAALRPRFRRRVALAVGAMVVAAFAVSCAERAYELNEDGLTAYRSGDYEAAIEAFEAAAAESPGDGEIALNLALAYHAVERYEDAERAAGRAAASNDRALRIAGYKALGHHRYSQQDWEGSLEAFHDVLLLAPDDRVALRDYEVVYAILYPPPPDEPDPGDEPGEPGDDETPTPADGDPGTPGPGGTATPDPAAPPDPSGTPAPGDPGSAPGPGASESELADRIIAIDNEVRSIEDSAGEQLTPEEALRLLELNAERNRLSALLEFGGDNQDPADR